MAALLPLLAMGIPALLSGVSGIMGIASEAKKLHGGKIRLMRHAARKHRVKRKRGGKLVISRYARSGKGPIADALSRIPLLGMIAGPLASAFGGRIRRKRRGHGFSPMYIHREFGGGMLTPPGGHMMPQQKLMSNAILPLVKMLGRPAFTYPPDMTAAAPFHIRAPGKASRIMYTPSARLRVGVGLLSPAGGRITHRKGYYKYVNGKRVHVAPTIVHTGGRVHKKRGGKLVHRKGYYKYMNGKRIHVGPTTVHMGGKIKRKQHKRKRGGYIPYQWRMRNQYH